VKRSVEALIRREMAAVAVAMATVLAAATPAAHAVSPVVQLQAKALLTPPSKAGGSAAPSKLRVLATFSTDTPGAQLFTVQQAVLFFPDRGTNGQLFPSCGAAQIERFHGDVSRCPKGSKVGTGSLTAQVLGVGVAASARVTLLSSHHGRSITFNFQTSKPAVINESFDAPLTRLHGKYGEKLRMDVPTSLQEVLPGLFVGLQTFDVTINAAATVHGVRYSFVEASVCPRNSMHGEFGFLDSATGQPAVAVADADLDCRVRRR
jgi:hypothetical protein